MSHEFVPVGDHWALGCQHDRGRGRGSVGGEDLGSIPMRGSMPLTLGELGGASQQLSVFVRYAATSRFGLPELVPYRFEVIGAVS